MSYNNKLLSYCRKGKLDKIKKLNLIIDDARSNNNIALKTASVYGQLDVVKYLIEEIGLTLGYIICDYYEASLSATFNEKYNVSNYLTETIKILEKQKKEHKEKMHETLDAIEYKPKFGNINNYRLISLFKEIEV